MASSVDQDVPTADAPAADHATNTLSAEIALPATQAAHIDRLTAEVDHLRRAMESHAFIDQARGMVMTVRPCDAQAAWDVLVAPAERVDVLGRGPGLGRPARGASAR